MNKGAKFANMVLGSIAVICLLVFIYALTKSSLLAPGDMKKYYIFSTAGFLFFVYILLRFNAEMKGKIALLVLSIIMSIYAIEIILSYNVKSNNGKILAKLAREQGIHYDSRHRTHVWMDLRNKGIDAYPLYSPYDNMELNETDILPLGFVSDKTIISCNESGEFVIYKTDEHGFNNADGLYNRGNTDYVLIGDSFAQGACVKREENIAGRLMAAGLRVLNLGMLNSGPPKELAILKEYGKSSKPKIVLWLFYEGNDYEGLAFEKRSAIYMKYLDRAFSRDLISKQKLIDDTLIKHLKKEFSGLTEERIKQFEERNSENDKQTFSISLSSLKLSMLRKRIGLFNEECSFKSDPLLKDIFYEANRTVKEWGGQIVFVYLPSYYRYAEKINQCKKRFLDGGRNEVLTVINDLQIPVIDIQSFFDSHPDPLSFFPYRLYGHYNAEGYKFVAEQIEKYLSDNSHDSGGAE